MAARKVITPGDRFGRFTILQEVDPYLSPRGRQPQRRFLCKCECGTEKKVNLSWITSGRVISCGCFQRELISRLRRTHGHSVGRKHSKVFSAWLHMRERCNNPNNKRYSDYGGRGIRVCDRWNNSFKRFLEDMGEPPTSAHTLDRYPNNNGDYEPNNCRWATMKEQAMNKRRPIRKSKINLVDSSFLRAR